MSHATSVPEIRKTARCNEVSAESPFFDRLSFALINGVFDPSLTGFTPDELSFDEAEYLSLFTDRIEDVKQAMADATAKGKLSNGAPSVSSGSVGVFPRCKGSTQDGDGDGILDHHEWMITGSDLNDASSTPDNIGGGGGIDPHQDEDQDGIFNAVDADPKDPNVDWETQAFSNLKQKSGEGRN
jgi:hypothetical protein